MNIHNNPFLSSPQVPIVKERRRFADVLDEEAEIKYQKKMEAWGRDDFSVYKPARGAIL